MTPRKQRPPPRDVFEVDLGGERLVVISISVEADQLDTLAKAELEVALDAIAGLSNRAIAAKRGRSARTIANQLASIYRKLGVGSRAELAARLAGK